MKKRYFWEKANLKKYRIIFENEEIIVGASRRNKYRTFRKDTGLIAFSRREILETKLSNLRYKEEIADEKTHFNNFDIPVLGFNFS
ncbi:MAG: hypothetical protein MUC29_02555 [Pyrinomonadaceae bacterium]|jgi:hypothetical protein|nr:hypothetical protein [Pyrinomonadaceae bacterium]